MLHRRGGLWRAHCDLLNTRLVERWLGARPRARVLKTDLYDEAMGRGLYGVLAARASTVVGIDVAARVAGQAARRHPGLAPIRADVRALPFADASFDAVVSISTLDHFATAAEIERSIGEIRRVLARAGVLLVTLDNRTNPMVALRNRLPSGWLRRTGLVPYPVGATLTARELRACLERHGFGVVEETALMHCPRALSVRRAKRLDHAPARVRERFARRLLAWERLGAWPTRYLSGAFAAVLATKR